MNLLNKVGLLLAMLLAHGVFTQEGLSPDEGENASTYDSTEVNEMLQAFLRMDSIERTLSYDTSGTVTLINGKVNIDIPEGYMFLDAQDAEIVLHDLWGNPPSTDTKGMLVPQCGVLGDSSFAITIEYSDEGHISDVDAQTIDYAELLEEMQSSTLDANKNRVAQGYEKIEIVGWASAPYYDNVAKKLYWAKEAKFGDAEENTLNYEVRVLGREGTLDLTFVAAMSQLPIVNRDIDKILASANFNQGDTYADYNESTDKTAEYGIAGLVAGGVLMKAAKVGVFAKFWKFILVGVAAVVAAVKKFFKGGSDN